MSDYTGRCPVCGLHTTVCESDTYGLPDAAHLIEDGVLACDHCGASLDVSWQPVLTEALDEDEAED